MDNKEEQIIRESNLYSAIKDVADYEMQKVVWLGHHSSYEIDYDETRANLYDNCSFKDFILDYKEKHGNDALLLKMEKLNTLLQDYRPNLIDEEILQDQRWIDITVAAQGVIDIWRLNKPDDNFLQKK